MVFAITLISGVIYTWFTFIIDKIADPGTPLRYFHLLVCSARIFSRGCTARLRPRRRITQALVNKSTVAHVRAPTTCV